MGGKTSTEAKQRYINKSYFSVRIKKTVTTLEAIQVAAALAGMSVIDFCTEAITEKIRRVGCDLNKRTDQDK